MAKTTNSRHFERNKERIVDAAAAVINRHGVRGMTLASVAKIVGLNTTSLTYYFKRKDLLAAAALSKPLRTMEGLLEKALAQGGPQSRVESFVEQFFQLHADMRRGEVGLFAFPSERRELDEPFRSELESRFQVLVELSRQLLGRSGNESDFLLTARASVLLSNILWMGGWITSYSMLDFERVRSRMLEIFRKGVVPEAVAWNSAILISPEENLLDSRSDMSENFLIAATHLINERGYGGASVEAISARLNVTKGSFYHHMPAKDDLIRECFLRSYHRVTLVQKAGLELDGANYRDRLGHILSTLIRMQMLSDFPLLRSTAWQTTPSPLREYIQVRADRITQRFASLVIDGISEGTLRPIDPMIAARMIMCMIDTAIDMREYSPRHGEEEATIKQYVSTLMNGLY